VVRINYQGNTRVNQKGNAIGSRTDISYYSKDTLANLNFSGGWAQLEELKFLVAPFLKYEFQRQLPFREISGEAPVYNGIPQRLQSIVLDLLRFEPDSIKLFNFNFYK
jgi:hypothetical protein